MATIDEFDAVLESKLAALHAEEHKKGEAADVVRERKPIAGGFYYELPHETDKFVVDLPDAPFQTFDYVMGKAEFSKPMTEERISKAPPSFRWLTVTYAEYATTCGDTFYAPADVDDVFVDNGMKVTSVVRFCLGWTGNLTRKPESEQCL